MIDIELTPALALYSIFLGILAGCVWLYTEVSVRRRQRFLGKQFLWRCVYCRYTYLDESAEQISRCPRCDSYNFVGDNAKEGTPMRAGIDERGERSSEDDPRRNPSRRKRPQQRRRGPRRRR